jgi:hypothetical protein
MKKIWIVITSIIVIVSISIPISWILTQNTTPTENEITDVSSESDNSPIAKTELYSEEFNSTHGYIVEVELGAYESVGKNGYNPRTYNPETGEYYESWDFTYWVELLNGVNFRKVRRTKIYQEFEVGDFVEINLGNDFMMWRFNITTMERIPNELDDFL